MTENTKETPEITKPPTAKELKKMAEGRNEVFAQNQEQLRFLAINNSAALQAVLQMKLAEFVNPNTGVPTEATLNVSKAETLAQLAAASAACSELF